MAIANTSNINTKKHVICKILHFEVEELMASVVLLNLENLKERDHLQDQGQMGEEH